MTSQANREASSSHPEEDLAVAGRSDPVEEPAGVDYTILVSLHVANIRIPRCLADPTVLAGSVSQRILNYLQVPASQMKSLKYSVPGDDTLEVTLPITFGETRNFKIGRASCRERVSRLV